MKRLKMPGFTAQDSLYRSGNRYRSRAGEPQGSLVIPQLGGPGFEGMGNCISDCHDLRPTWSTAKCAKACRASEIGAPKGGGGGNIEAGCRIYYYACLINPFNGLCDLQYQLCLLG